MDKTRILIVCFAVLGFGGGCDGLLCNCTTSQCEKNGYRCETTGACMASASLIDGQEQHMRTCIDKEKLVPPGQPFFCLSVEGLLNIHCCYTDYCNSVDLKVTSGLGAQRYNDEQPQYPVFPKLLKILLRKYNSQANKIVLNGPATNTSDTA
ncbi:hypothetical protein KOW79_009895 [Hemibagrus wyckioides]|uniref:Activin types I and II receptor domain-containing protein n=1 Tax=Hemibagrus wyckioides TaxID=337641 RepID=A0A9D3SP47_9TELE|nr:activin receptor type-1B-like [Hemibagrus wyckioides]KAG7326494.1 hypothetical protein KOW79_009895 [Hemibagrus wyckioides]